MSAENEYCDGGCDSCETVVVRAYRSFRAFGGDDRAAFRVAVQVLCLRHPERSQEENADLASDWIARALESSGATTLN